MYNKHMSTIIIEGPERAIRAGTWAENNIKDNWNLNLMDPFSNNYHFTFSNPDEASMFALKWAQ